MLTFAIRTPTRTLTECTTGGVAWTLLALAKGDPEVTYMPTVTHEDGSPLTDEESSAVDWWMDRHDYERITPMSA